MRLPLQKCTLLLFASIMFGILSTAAYAQRRAPRARGNPDIRRIIGEISALRIEADIRKLVSFGTRNTLSEQNNPNRGIGAARDWLYAQFQKAAAESGELATPIPPRLQQRDVAGRESRGRVRPF